MSAFDDFISFVWRPENDGARSDSAAGESFVTVRGVTEPTWQGAIKAGLIPLGSSLAAATDDQLRAVLKWACWDSCWGDLLDRAHAGRVAIVIANMAMMAGRGAAVKTLQRVLGGSVVVDGVMGAQTVAALLGAIHGGRDMIGDLTEAEEAFFMSLTRLKQFWHGWKRRARDCEEYVRWLS